MIVLENLTKVFRRHNKTTVVADNISAVFPTGKAVGLIGQNGAGKSTLLRMIAGTSLPSTGHVQSDGTVSWPVGYSGSFHPELTGAQNVRFVARIYGVDSDALVDYVNDFSELGHHYHQHFRTYSSGMKARLAMGTSMGIDFDTYLVDEVTSVGDAVFRKKSQVIFADRMKNSSAIFVSHSMGLLRKMCTLGAVLHNGQLDMFDDIEDAISFHHESMGLGKEEEG